MNKKSSKFHFVIDFWEDLTREQEEQRLESALAQIRSKWEKEVEQ